MCMFVHKNALIGIVFLMVPKGILTSPPTAPPLKKKVLIDRFLNQCPLGFTLLLKCVTVSFTIWERYLVAFGSFYSKGADFKIEYHAVGGI